MLLLGAAMAVHLSSYAQSLMTKPCHLPGMRDAVLCGTLSRPLNPEDPQGRRISIHIALMPSKAREKLPDPIYVLAGGPGQSAIDLMPAMQGTLSRLNNRRDLVFVDQRGTGKSAPLTCGQEARLSLSEVLDPGQLPARMSRCLDALEKLPHGDLRYYSTTIAMHDLDAVRTALGQGQINLVGASYGSRAALEYLRLFPQHVRRMVIDGVAPATMSLTQSMADDANTAWKALVADCGADAGCVKRYPALALQWERMFTALPQTVTVNNPLTGAREQLILTAPMVAGMVRGPLYAPQLAAGLPNAVSEAAQKNWTPLIGLASTNLSRAGGSLAMGLHFSVICAEDPLREASATTAGRFAGVMDRSYQAVCASWPKSKVDQGFYTLRASPAPVLMFSGGVDPATPPRHATEVANAMGEKVRHIVVPNAGHGILRLGCASDIVFKFIDHKQDAPALKVDAACLSNIPRPKAFVPLSAALEGGS